MNVKTDLIFSINNSNGTKYMIKKKILLSAVVLMSIFNVTLSFANETNIKSFALDAVEKGWAYFNRGDYETAFKRFHQATVIDPDFAPGYFGKAYIYSIQDNLDSAIENYRKTIRAGRPTLQSRIWKPGFGAVDKGAKCGRA